MTPRMHPDAVLALVAVFFAASALEVVAFARAGKRYAWREVGASLAVAALQRIVNSFSIVVLVPLFAGLWKDRLFTISLVSAGQIAAVFVLFEFAYYWMHRASHGFELIWATHSVHHSPEQLNLPSSMRLGATGLVSFEWFPFVPLVVLGVEPNVVASLFACNLAYQFFLHTEMIPRLGPIEWVFNTPSHHRVHHARNAVYLDRNFGGVLIVFDRLFGTYQRELETERPVFGLVGERRGNNPLRILFGGWSRLALVPLPRVSDDTSR